MDFKKDWFEVAKKVILRPSEFFGDMKTEGNYDEPMIFAAINFMIFGVIIGLISGGLGAAVSSAIGKLIQGVIGLFIGSGILHVLLKLVGANKKHEATFRVMAYMSVFYLLVLIPISLQFTLYLVPQAFFYSILIIYLYMLYAVVVGFAKAHEISILRSSIAVMSLALFLIMLWVEFLHSIGVESVVNLMSMVLL